MDINTNKDINILYNLLETLANLHVTYVIDKMYVDPLTGKCRVYYVKGLFVEPEDKDES